MYKYILGVVMIEREDNPEFVNSFLDYTITILNKSPNTVKEYNYDIANFLKYIKKQMMRQQVYLKGMLVERDKYYNHNKRKFYD